MSKICFLIPDGVGIRNYLYSGVLSQLRKNGHEVSIWHSLEEEVIQVSEGVIGFRPQSYSLEIFPDDFLTQLLRESTSFARLLHNVQLTGNETLMANWSFGNIGFKKKLLVKLSELLGRSMSSYPSILSVEGILWKKIRKSQNYLSARKKLQEIRPDVLFCTHQRMANASAAILAAQDLGIKTSAAIFSWDNLPKARLAMRPDVYLVWSKYMKDELSFFYPEISIDQIEVTGTPQFDFYTKKELIESREKFADQFGLDPSKHWVLFSGDDAKTSPHDSSYLRDIAEQLRGEASIQLIFRQVPVEDTSRYQVVLENYPEIIHINPFWKKGDYWQAFFPYPEDISHLVNLAYHCSTVINIGSTMAMDFAFFDKPALYLNYDHQPEQVWTVRDIYRFQHFRSMDGLDPVGWITSPTEIKNQVLRAIQEPEQIGKDRKKWLSRIAEPDFSIQASDRIAGFLESISSPQLKEV